MEHFDDIEKFAKGNRISPSASATSFPKGTLGLGNDGNVWVNYPDKNGVVRWQKEILVGFYDNLSIGNYSKDYFEFQFNVDDLEFTLVYKYESGISIISNIGNYFNREISKVINYWERFEGGSKIYDKIDDSPRANQINFEILRLMEKLSSLTFQMNPLRNATSNSEPVAKFKVGDKVTYNGLPLVYEIESVELNADDMFIYTCVYDTSSIKLPETMLDLAEETPEFKVGDFVVDDTWSFPLKIKKLDSGNGQFECVQADGYNENDSLYTIPEKTKLFEKQPKFKVGDRILYPTTQNGSALGSTARVLIQQAQNEKLGYLVITNITYNRYGDDEFNYWLGFQKRPNDSVSFQEQECKPYDPNPQSKFKVGDKIKLPTTCWGRTPEGSALGLINLAKAKNQPFLYVDEIANELNGLWLTLNEGVGVKDIFKIEEDNLELYEENLTPFQQINFLQPSTEENDIIIKTMAYYSDGLTFEAKNTANLSILFDGKTSLVIAFFDQVNNIIKLRFPSKNINVWSTEIQQKITNESLTEIAELYLSTLNKLFDYVKDEKQNENCEADPSKIQSGQVQVFYQNNKTRIDKLNSDFSCKIIQALVSLSEYEKCGSPSSATLGKAKTDLLSRISKLKV